MNLPSDHVPAWVDKARLAAETCLEPREVDSWVFQRLIPKPVGRRWFWPLVDGWIIDGPPDSLSGYVYFIEGGEFIKIGFSVDPGKRLLELQCASPFDLSVIALMPARRQEDENRLHKRFSDLRANGEWFRKDDSLLAFIERETRIYDSRLFA